jgi:eukaryotic-like serine/threonine-protein kinase
MNEGAVRRRRIMDAFDAVLDLPPEARAERLRRDHPDDPDLVAAVEALAAADAQPTLLPSNLHAHEELVPPERVGHYRLDRRLGQGGMGEVWLAHRDDGLFEHAVAVKLMQPALLGPELAGFFDRERRLLARMRHPHIARLFDGGVAEGGIPWFAMDLVDGVPLDEWARAHPARGRERLAARVRLIAAVGEAVQHAHQQLIVHADLKPGNILVDAEGEPRLVDFGIAQILGAQLLGGEAGGTDAYPRTPSYASPERLAGGRPSIADDVFALGTVLHGLLTNHWPAAGETVAGPPSAVADPAHAPLLRGDLDAIVARARAREPERRYATTGALVADLHAWLDRRPVAARAGGPAYRARRFVRRNRWPVAAAAAAVLALLVGTVTSTALYLRAERQRAAAERRFADVRALARYMLVDFHDALEPLAGASPLRARTAKVGRAYLERLSREPHPTPDLLKELGVGYGRVGHTLAVTATNGTRGMEEGDRALARAEAVLTQLVRDHPDRHDLKVELARVLTWRSSVQNYARSDPAGAERLLARAFALDDAVLRARPGDTDAAYGRWLAVLGRVDLLSTGEHYREMVALAADQLRRVRTLPTPPEQAGVRPLMEAALLNAWGDGLYGLGEVAGSLDRYVRAYRRLDAPAAQAAADVRVLTRRVAYAYQVSGSEQALGHRAAALGWAERGLADAAALRRFENSPVLNGVTNLVLLQHATLLVESGRPAEAMAEARASVAERLRSARAEPASDDAWASYLYALRPFSEIADLARRPAEACAAARTAKGGWHRLYRGRTMPERQANDLARVEARLARCA